MHHDITVKVYILYCEQFVCHFGNKKFNNYINAIMLMCIFVTFVEKYYIVT